MKGRNCVIVLFNQLSWVPCISTDPDVVLHLLTHLMIEMMLKLDANVARFSIYTQQNMLLEMNVILES